MLTMNVVYHCKPGQREAFYEALCQLGTRRVSIQEEGNRQYDYFFSAENPDDLLLIETWEEVANHTAHSQTETFAGLQALKAQYCENTTIGRFNY